jgi:uncharacterized membrane protein YkvA (DUF1232 family)
MLDKLKSRARALKIETYAIYLAARHPRTPWYAKAIAFGTVAYALSPIDLIPDFIPVIGYLDDLILVPAGIALALKMIPAEVMEEARKTASSQGLSRAGPRDPGRGIGWIGAGTILLIWILAIIGIASLVLHLKRSP